MSRVSGEGFRPRKHVIPVRDIKSVCFEGNLEVDVEAAFVPSSEMTRILFGALKRKSSKRGATNPINHNKPVVFPIDRLVTLVASRV